MSVVQPDRFFAIDFRPMVTLYAFHTESSIKKLRSTKRRVRFRLHHFYLIDILNDILFAPLICIPKSSDTQWHVRLTVPQPGESTLPITPADEVHQQGFFCASEIFQLGYFWVCHFRHNPNLCWLKRGTRKNSFSISPVRQTKWSWPIRKMVQKSKRSKTASTSKHGNRQRNRSNLFKATECFFVNPNWKIFPNRSIWTGNTEHFEFSTI